MNFLIHQINSKRYIKKITKFILLEVSKISRIIKQLIMNFSQSAKPQSKGSFVWKRNANTSQTDRNQGSINRKKPRLNSESSDYSILGETQPNWNIKTTTSKSKNKSKKEQWNEIKSIAKYSTIASRLQLKKTVPVSFLNSTDKKSPIKDKGKSSFDKSTFANIIDSQGNITKSFKQTKEFKSLNPHIIKDVDKMRKRVYSMYQKQKKEMNNFLTENQTLNLGQHVSIGKTITKSISLLEDYDENTEMQKISERQQYESRMNSTRIKESCNQQRLMNSYLQANSIKCSFTKKETAKYIEQIGPSFTKKQNKCQIKSKSVKKEPSVTSTTPNSLLKGLLGEYSNYERLPKHQLIQKLISLEYLAQNIFKKNKFLQQELDKKQIALKPTLKNSQPLFNNKKNNKQNKKIQQFQKDLSNKNDDRRDLFMINNDDGYFNQFLQSEKDKQNQVYFQTQDQPQRFRQNQKPFRT